MQTAPHATQCTEGKLNFAYSEKMQAVAMAAAGVKARTGVLAGAVRREG